MTSSVDSPGDAALMIFVIRGVTRAPIPPVIDGLRTRVRESSRFRAGYRGYAGLAGRLAGNPWQSPYRSAKNFSYILILSGDFVGPILFDCGPDCVESVQALFVVWSQREYSEAKMAHAEQFLKIVNDAKKRVKVTNVADVKRRRDGGEKFVLVDVREDNEWAAGHLPGSIHLGRGIIERDIEKTVPDTAAKIILYCGGGFRSALAADNLQKMGYTNVESMDGGWKGWVDAGLPTEK